MPYGDWSNQYACVRVGPHLRRLVECYSISIERLPKLLLYGQLPSSKSHPGGQGITIR